MMAAFPQLASGAMAQFPIDRTIRFRTRWNEIPDGSVVQLADQDYEERHWDLRFTELTDAEWQALEDLFAASCGRLGSFTFLEPGANLLAWSEQLTQAPWSAAGSVLDGQPDPFGGSRGSRLGAGSSATQTIAAPSHYRYAASAWLRTTDAGAKLRIGDSAGQNAEQEVETNGQWKRYSALYSGSSSKDAMRFELIAGGAALDVCGPQLEAQRAPSAYKISSGRGGVFANTRFDQDVLVDEASGPGRHNTRIKLVWTPSQL